MRKYLTAILGLEVVAVLLAWVHALSNVRTDEAKYLLDIPYPHPPFLRGIMHALEAVPFQEMFWRIVFASMFVQAVWLVWDMGKFLARNERIALCGVWLLSAGVLLWTGAIMIAPVNAVQGLVFVWLLFRPELTRKYPALVSIFWLVSLLTGYQAILYFPLTLALYWRQKFSIFDVALYVFGPIAVLMLYTLSNPLALASLLHHGGEQTDESLGFHTYHTVRLWLVGGSIVASVVGLIGIIRSRKWELICALLCVTGFIFLNWFEYYSILFSPLLVAGVLYAFDPSTRGVSSEDSRRARLGSNMRANFVFALFDKRLLRGRAMLLAMWAGSILTLWLWSLPLSLSAARDVSQKLQENGVRGTVLIAGTFGHDWQYESLLPILRFAPERVASASAIVCLAPCAGWTPGPEWRQMTGLATQVWLRR